jgi:hypothetical protein
MMLALALFALLLAVLESLAVLQYLLEVSCERCFASIKY